MKKFFTAVIITGVLVGSVLLAGCEKKNDNFTSDAVADYWNLQTGKYITYRLDSTIFVNFGQKDTVISYQAKDVVEGQVTDNLNRPGWRIVRYLRDTGSTSEDDWKPTLTYQVIPSRQNIEVNEANFRYLKLVIPVREGYSWHGNSYLPDNPYVDLYEFSNDEDIQSWDYTYQNVGASAAFNNKNYDSTISVLQIADSTNLPLTAGIPASKTYWVETYAKHIGLVYKEVVMWEYQPPTNTTSGYRHGFGIKMTILDHN